MSDAETPQWNRETEVGIDLPHGPEQQPHDQPRIYVASLSDYNAGRLHGVWLDAAQEPAGIHVGIDAMLALSEEPVAEEWAIHDFDGFAHVALDEYESIERVSTLARGIAAHGEAFAAWWSVAEPEGADLDELSSAFEHHYRGEWDSTETYAEELLTDMGVIEALERLPDWLAPYVSLDAEQFGRDLVYGGDIATVESRDGGIFVFERAST